MKTVSRMASHVHELIEIAALRPAVASVVRTLLDGITATGSVVLSEALRLQVATDKELHAAEQRASQALKHEASLDDLPKAYLGLVAPAARSLRFRSLDGSWSFTPRCSTSLAFPRDTASQGYASAHLVPRDN